MQEGYRGTGARTKRRGTGGHRLGLVLPSTAIIAAVGALGMLLLFWGGAQALAACSGPCGREALLTGLANPPAWAASRHIHFAPSSSLESAYAPGPPAAQVLARGLPTGLLGALANEGEGVEGKGPLLYHEGDGVQEKPKVFLIFWGSNFDLKEVPSATEIRAHETKETLLKLYNGLSNSAWQGILTQYFDSTGRVSPEVEVAQYVDKREPAPKSVGHVRIEEEVPKAIELVQKDSGVSAAEKEKWKPGLNADFMVVTAPGSSYEGPKTGCAYHGVTLKEHTSQEYIYSFVPYQGDPPYSTENCLNGQDPVQETSKTSSHEYAETVTDPVPPTVGESTEEWTSRLQGAGEIGDLCTYTGIFPLEKTGAWVQELYDDHLNKCELEDADPPYTYAVTGSAGAGGVMAAVSGIVNPERANTSYFFQYGLTTEYGDTIPAPKSPEGSIKPGETNRNVEVRQTISGLQPNTTYHYRLAADNEEPTHGGITYSVDKTFTTAAETTPFVSGVEPEDGPEVGGTPVTITGAYLGSVKSVKFGSVGATSFVVNSETSISAVAPPGSGVVDVTVANAVGTSAANPADRFGYGGVPTVTKVEPSKGPENGGTAVTITGTSLKSATNIKFTPSEAQGFRASRKARSFVVNSETSITAVSPEGSGPVDVTVTNSRGTSPVSSGDKFEYVPDPTVSEVQPYVGPQAGGSNVTITGTNLKTATAVKFGSAAAGSVEATSETSLKAVSPPGTGVVDVTVTNPTGTSVITNADRFAYEPPSSSTSRPVAWGGNAEGQLGDGGRTESSVLPVAVSGLSEVSAISAGQAFSLALLGNGTVEAWGNNEHGQLGEGTTESSVLPVPVSGLSEVQAISAGNRFGLALLKNGTVVAWGDGLSGQLGNGTTTDSDVPVAVSGLSKVIAISAGEEFSLALLKNGTVMAWGENRLGQLGDGTTKFSDVPMAVSGLSEIQAISAGGNHALALLHNGTVMAWGANRYGQLGDGSATGPQKCTLGACSTTPVPVSGLSKASAISAGEFHSLALLSNGTVRSWGLNGHGQLGDGTTENSDLPVAVCAAAANTPCTEQARQLSTVSAISAGGRSGLALLHSGALVAWGENFYGQLGNGTNTGPEECSSIACSKIPVAVSGLSEVSAISIGGNFSLAIGLG